MKQKGRIPNCCIRKLIGFYIAYQVLADDQRQLGMHSTKNPELYPGLFIKVIFLRSFQEFVRSVHHHFPIGSNGRVAVYAG